MWVDDLILLLAPNLEDIIPDTGLIKDIPKLAVPPEVFNEVLTVPDEAYLVEDVFLFFATTTGLGFSTYSFDIASSEDTKSFISVSYFSIIDMLSILELSFSFKPFITPSACSKLETYNFSSLLSTIA